MRYTNTKGNIIPLHHAFTTIRFSPFVRISTLVLPVFFCALIWLMLPIIMDMWSSMFSFWMAHIYQGHVAYSEAVILGQYVQIPYPVLETDAPSTLAVWINLVVCVLAFLLAFLIPARLAPMKYLLCAALLIQASASLDRLVIPDFFPYTLQGYLVDALTMCMYLFFLLPVILGMIYYIFDFSLWRKCIVTLGILVYFCLAVPSQYMLHACIIHELSLLFLPLMYMLFGVLLDVLMFVSLYSFGLSWGNSRREIEGRRL